jgi:hypothetical protein
MRIGRFYVEGEELIGIILILGLVIAMIIDTIKH